MGRTSHIERPRSAYRQVDRISYSMISDYLKDYKKYFRKHVLKETVVETDNEFLLRGNLVDCLKTDKTAFDSLYLISKASIPAPQMKTFCELLFNIRTKNPDWDFSDCTLSAYKRLCETNVDKDGKIKKVSTGYEKYIENFSETATGYFQELLESVHRTVISVEDATIAESIVRKIEACEAFKPRGNRTFHKVVIMFTYGDWSMKAEVDEIEVDDTNKVIYPFDYKTSSFLDNFTIKGYLGNNYYIQQGLYKFAIDSQWKVNNGMEDYRVENMAFKVVDQADWLLPLLYKTTDEHYEQAFTGFYAGLKYYKGIDQVLSEIKYHTEADNWSMSVENIKNNGEVYIPSFKQKQDE